MILEFADLTTAAAGPKSSHCGQLPTVFGDPNNDLVLQLRPVLRFRRSGRIVIAGPHAFETHEVDR